jgi:hypothetical protein
MHFGCRQPPFRRKPLQALERRRVHFIVLIPRRRYEGHTDVVFRDICVYNSV